MTTKPSYEELEKRVQELQESEIYYRTLLESVNDAVLVHEIGFDGMPDKFIDANRVALKRLGYTHDELLKLTPKDITTENGYKELSEARANITSNSAAIFETTHLARNGRPVPVESHVNVVELAGKRVAVSVVRDLSERKLAEEAQRESLQRLEFALQGGKLGMWDWNPQDGAVIYNDLWAQMLEYRPDEVEPTVEFFKQHVHPEDLAAVLDRLTGHVEGRLPVYESEHRFRTKSGRWLWVLDRGKIAERDKDGRPVRVTGLIADITERKQAEGELKRIEWMLSRKPVPDINAQTEQHDQGYGDLTELNRDGIILKSIGPERLKSFANDYLELLGTSSAIYEVNGDYAFGIFASGWCRMMDRASRNLCNTPGNVEALNSGRWLCHESCWTDCSKEAIAKRAPVDIECNGGIRLYAVPIFAGGNVIGAINFGYGDPPKDPEKLKMLADVYDLNHDDLFREATAYDSRPRYIIEMAKNRLNSTAKLIGSMVETKQVMEALGDSEEKFRSLVEQAAEMLFLHDLKGHIIDVNLAASQNTGYSSEELKRMSVFDIDPDAHDRADMQNYWESFKIGDPPASFEVRHKRKNGSIYPAEVVLSKIALQTDHYILALAHDITSRKQAEAEREKLQTQLNQAQKMESVGRLAGGVAHDFNNMLGVILGHTELALLQADKNHDLYSDLKEIQTAAKRSADITKQLLAFARKQIISPKQIDLNDTVESMLNMLRRLIGEDIDLVWQAAAHLWPVKMDPSQIDQILANLCINARDAISGVGKLTIETGTKTFDKEYCRDHLGFIPGDFVLLAVSDNGCGMDKNTLDNLFEPFFTTKEVGKGTGLGLATIYGIVKQNNGFINVYSEPGQGSTFKIYLPRLVVTEDNAKAVPEKRAAAGGAETILLVEDEPTILRMTRMMLERKGYSVLSAATPAEAIEKATHHSGPIDLLMTDVVMPEMNGRDLAGQVIPLYPEIKLLFMSGYTANVIAHHGVLDKGVAFIQKPFTMIDMVAKVRDVLDTASDKN